jgi:glycerol uptake facilitator-like aquaporin
VAEAVGTALLVAAVVGSGIMGARLAGANVALALLVNSLATGGALVALILALGSISGAHFNPLVTIAAASLARLSWRDVPIYVAAQLAGAFAGTALAHVMFGLPLFFAGQRERAGLGLWTGEIVATFGLLATILGCARRPSPYTALAVGSYIVAAYWFTSSTSFANPAITLARSVTDTFSGIRPVDVPAFVGAQVVGAAAATLLFRWLLPQGDST